MEDSADRSCPAGSIVSAELPQSKSSSDSRQNSDFALFSSAGVVERTFAWFDQHRRLLRDYEQSLYNVTVWVFLALILRVMLSRHS